MRVCSALHTLTVLHKLSPASTDFVGSHTGDKELEIRQKHGVMAFQQHSGIVDLRSSLVVYLSDKLVISWRVSSNRHKNQTSLASVVTMCGAKCNVC